MASDEYKREYGQHLVDQVLKGQMTRRQLLVRATVFGFSLTAAGSLLAACGGSTSETASPAASGSGAPEPVMGGSLTGIIPPSITDMDPVTIYDQGGIILIQQVCEYLIALDNQNGLKPSLAESWEGNDDASVWTFKLRQGVTFNDGSPMEAADVVATMDRLAGSNLKASIAAGSTKAIDDFTVEITLLSPDGQFPQQVGAYNPQSVITPKDFVLGTTLDKRMTGTGAFKMTRYDAATGATFEANPDWWGGKPFLDKLEYTFSEDLATLVSGLQGGAADAITQFSVVGGDAILNDSNLNVQTIRGSAHRQIWMNCREGDFTDVKVRQAIALGIDRQALIDTILKGKGDIANDHPIAPIYPFFDASQPQRERDVEKAKQLLTEAGKSGLKATMAFPDLQEIPQLAQLVQSQLKDIGMEVTLLQEAVVDGEEWCKVYDSTVEPAGCDGGMDFGIVDYGLRGVPDVYLVKAYATGEWNSAHYISEPFRAAVKAYQGSLDLEGQKAAIKDIQKIANEDVPYAIPYFYNILFATTKNVSGIVATGLGQFYCGKAGFTA
jgi:peptide/nickel transport system substrate-binding protein